MLKFLNLDPEVFGVDINDLSMRVVKIKKKPSGFQVVSFNEFNIQPGVVKEGVIRDQNALVEIIRLGFKSIKGERLGAKFAVISLPEEKSFLQVIQLPVMTEEELKFAVPYQVENYIPLPLEKIYLDFEILDYPSQSRRYFELLINAIPKPIVDHRVTCFKRAGLTPCVLEVESQAIVRALLNDRISQKPVIFIDLGCYNTSLIIFARNSIRFTASIPVSSEQLTENIAKSLSINFKEAEKLKIKYGLTQEGQDHYKIKSAIMPVLNQLADHIKKYLSFYYGHIQNQNLADNGKIEKIILCGGGAKLEKLPDFLYRELKISTEVGNPFINIVPSQGKDGYLISENRKLAFTTALGLAIRGAEHQFDI